MSFPLPTNLAGAPAPPTGSTAHQQQQQQQHIVNLAPTHNTTTPSALQAPVPVQAGAGPQPPSNNAGATTENFPQLSASTEEILKRVSANGGAHPGWQAAREQVLQHMVTTQDIPTPPPAVTTRGRGGRGVGRASATAQTNTPRRASSATTTAAIAGTPSTATTTGGRGRGRGRGGGGGGRRGGGRRKRTKHEEDSDHDDETSSGNSSNSETLTSFPTKTKSGRRVHRPAQYDPATKTPTRRRGPYRRMAEATVCRVCQRGHSVPRNMIVFCDGCNMPYHQYCHNPPIDDEVVRVEEMEWFCVDCVELRKSAMVGVGGAGSGAGSGIGEVDLRTAVSGEGLSFDEKRTYFTLLPISSLINILMHATMVHPDLAIFAPDAKAQVTRFLSQKTPAHDSGLVNQFAANLNLTSSNTTPQPNEQQLGSSTVTVPLSNEIQQQQQLLLQQQAHQLYQQNNQQQQPQQLQPTTYFPYRHYPKPGNGPRLPPLTPEELAFLVDDDLDAFTHLCRGLPIMNRGYVAEFHSQINADDAGNGDVAI